MKTIIHLSELVQATDGCTLYIYDKNFGSDKAKLLKELALTDEKSVTFASNHKQIMVSVLSMDLEPFYKKVFKVRGIKTNKVHVAPLVDNI